MVGGGLTTPDNGTIALTGTGIDQAALIRAGNEAAPMGGTVDLGARTGGIAQSTTAARIVADTLRVDADAEVTLRAGLNLGDGGSPAGWNAVGTLSGTAAGAFQFHNAGGFVVGAGVIAGGTSVSFRVNSGTVTQAAGSPMDTPNFSADLGALGTGALILDGGSAGTTDAADLNRIDAFGAILRTGAITRRNATGVVLGTTQSLAVGATPPGDVTLHAQTGSLTRVAGTNIVGGTLRVSAPADPADLDTNVAALSASTVSGNLTLREFNGLSISGPVLVGGAAGGTATLNLTFGGVSQAAGGSLSADRLAASVPFGSLLLNGVLPNSVGAGGACPGRDADRRALAGPAARHRARPEPADPGHAARRRAGLAGAPALYRPRRFRAAERGAIRALLPRGPLRAGCAARDRARAPARDTSGSSDLPAAARRRCE